MEKIDLKNICLEYLPRYESEGIDVSLDKLIKLALRASKKAVKTYIVLKEPRVCSENIYIDNWVREELIRDFAIKTVKPISLKKPPASFKASADFYLLLPPELHRHLITIFFNSKAENRKKTWNSLKLPTKEIEQKFIRMTEERIKFAQNKGYATYVDMFLDKNKIPRSDYERFLKNIDKLVKYCNSNLPKTGVHPEWFYSEFNLPCFMCRLSSFPFKSFDEVLDYVVKTNKILGKFKQKVIIKFGEKSKMSYKKETDSFEITISKTVNIRHQITDLVHELSHVIDYLQDLSAGKDLLSKGKYVREKSALIIELSILKRLSQPWYQSNFSEALQLFRRLLFEIELYSDPDQDLSKLYAETFNRCFKLAKQKSNPAYILDERISLLPLDALPHAIAHSEVILEMMNK